MILDLDQYYVRECLDSDKRTFQLLSPHLNRPSRVLRFIVNRDIWSVLFMERVWSWKILTLPEPSYHRSKTREDAYFELFVVGLVNLTLFDITRSLAI